jgi:hypothetical protein
MSLRIAKQQPLIDKISRTMRRKFSALQPCEVNACCLEAMWVAIQRQDEGNEYDLATDYYHCCLSKVGHLADWYMRRAKHVAFIDREVRIEVFDDPILLLLAQEALEACERPVGDIKQEVMEALDLSEWNAKRLIKDAKEALEMSDKKHRWSDSQKREILKYLGVQIGSPAQITISSVDPAYKQLAHLFSDWVAAAFLMIPPDYAQPASLPRSNQ